jgi:hypothetical protein
MLFLLFLYQESNKFAMCKVCDLNECEIITNKYVDLLDNCKSYIIAK